MKIDKQLFIIFGPTAVGKTDLALRIAQYIPAEIINMDVGQCYTPLSIGTAKPDWHNNPIPHHLFDICDEPQHLTVVEYRDLLQQTLNTIWRNKKLPIIVGGSGFYLQSLLFPPQGRSVSIDIKKFCSADTNLWELLKKIDPVRAITIDKHDNYRINRALKIWYTTGQIPSKFIPSYTPIADYFLLWVTREKDDLYTRINDRVIKMIDQGWIDEVKSLQGTAWGPFIQRKKIIGYNDIYDYLLSIQHVSDLDSTIKKIQKKTRNYAKRQHTFWRMLEKKLNKVAFNNEQHKATIESVNLTLIELHLYIKQLLKQLSVVHFK